MKTSTTVKVLLAIFLAAFLWIVIVSIQQPRKGPATEEIRELRSELVSRTENITLEAGTIKILAKVQEIYRNGEIHYQDFTIVQERDDNRLTVTGRTAQTRSEGGEISFVTMEGAINVRSSEGLRLKTRSLNFEGSRNRIFTNDPCTYSINNLSGRSQSFIFYTESRLLELEGDVRARMNLGDEGHDVALEGVDEATAAPEAAGADEPADTLEQSRQERRAARRELKREEREAQAQDPTTRRDVANINCDRAVYDQQQHTLQLTGHTRIARGGSYILGERVDARLTDDNRQFTHIDVFESNILEEAQPETTPKDTQAPPLPSTGTGTLSHHTGGIKTLHARELHLDFTTGVDNVISTVQARGAAEMEITPTGRPDRDKPSEMKKITGEVIDATLGEGGVGIRDMRINSAAGQPKAHIDITPMAPAPRRKRRGAETATPTNEPKAKSATARSFDITVDPETNDFSIIVMTGGVEFVQGELVTTSDSARYEKATEKLQITGKPVLRDGVKRVTSQSAMTVSLDIGDLSADNTVESLFYAKRSARAEGPALFAIGGGALEDTIITAGSLRLDYRNNVLRYAGNVRVNQGDTTIQSQNLDIFLTDSRLIAYGAVSADLGFAGKDKSAEKPAARAGKPAAGKDGEGKRVFLSGERLEINKKKRSIRIVKNARAEQSGMILTAEQEISYDLDEEDQLLAATARTNVRVDLETFAVFGDKAVFNFGDRLLQVDGKNVRYLQEGKTEGSYGRVEYEMETGAMKFFSRADQLVKTKILK